MTEGGVSCCFEMMEQTCYPAWCHKPEAPHLNTEHNLNLVNFKYEKQLIHHLTAQSELLLCV